MSIVTIDILQLVGQDKKRSETPALLSLQKQSSTYLTEAKQKSRSYKLKANLKAKLPSLVQRITLKYKHNHTNVPSNDRGLLNYVKVNP
jgi:hypothetical protein